MRPAAEPPGVLAECLQVLRWVAAESLAHRRHSTVETTYGLPKRVVRQIRSMPGVVGERGARAELRLVRVTADLQQTDSPIPMWP